MARRPEKRGTGLITGDGHILISGTGRAGSTLLVQILTHLNFDTGFSKDEVLMCVDSISKAGLEWSLNSETLPYVVKSPWFSDEIGEALERGIQIEAAIIPFRNLFDAAESRRHVYRQAKTLETDPTTHPGTIWKTVAPSEQTGALTLQFYKLLEPLVAHNVPLYFLNFPRFVEDAEYFYKQLEPIFARHEIRREEVVSVHGQIADPKLVTRFTRPVRALCVQEAAIRQLHLSSGLGSPTRRRMDTYISPISFWWPDHAEPSAWIEHAAFAFWLTKALRPRTFVELGTQGGYSYYVFCQAVKALGLDTRCHAVDHWKGDEHAGFYGEEVYERVRDYNERHYAAFSSLVRSAFDDALDHFSGASIDLLHIDGRHFYEDVKHDFVSWRPKLSERSVVLFHDTNVRERNFGVFKLWEELRKEFPSFEFLHGHGLGVLGYGSNLPGEIKAFFAAMSDSRVAVDARRVYRQLGGAVHADLTNRQSIAERDGQIASLQEAVAERDARVEHLSAELNGVQETVAERDGQIASLQEAVAERDARVEHLSAELNGVQETVAERDGQIASLQESVAERDVQVRGIYGSTSWRVTAPLRAVKRALVAIIGTLFYGRVLLGRTARAVYHRLPISDRKKRKLKSILYKNIGFLFTNTETYRHWQSVQAWRFPAETNSRVDTCAIVTECEIIQPEVVFISGLPDNASHAYRVEHQVDALNAVGITAEWYPIHEIDHYQHRIIFSQVVVLFRVAWDTEVARIVEKCRKAGVRVLFDIDDYVFDQAIANEQNVDGLRFLKPEELPLYFDGVRRYRQSAANADECIVTTDFLAGGVRELGKPYHVIRNGFSRKTLQASETALAEAPSGKSATLVRLGYASGSMTHQRDFATAVPAVAQIMAENQNIVLTVVGLLDLNEFPELEAFSDRIETRDLVPLRDLPCELVRFDINLAPLELGNPYCEAKSELKYYEAALVHVPTIAAATSPFRSAIDDGVTGFLARTNDEWYRALNRLVNDRALRTQIAAAAYRHALAEYGPDAKQRQVAAVFRPLIENRKRQLQTSPEAYSQTITFVVPGMVRGSGGHNKILSIVKWLAYFGYTVLVTFTEKTIDYPTPDTITDEYGLDERYVRIVYSNKLVVESNITFATYWKTVYNIKKSEAWPGRQYHFLQDYEAYFFPMGTDYLLAVNALHKNFKKVTYGPWIKKIISERHRLCATEIPFYTDKDLYHADPTVARKANQVLYFARPEMPRRCFDLGIEALRIYQQIYGDEAEIVLFGSDAVAHIDLPFGHVNLKVLSPPDLARLYNEATVGIVFSPTNPSMVPFEMMACGLPVIDLDVEGNAVNYGGRENAILVSPDPKAIAETIHETLNNNGARELVAQNGHAFASAMCTEEQAIRNLVEIIMDGANDRSEVGARECL